MIQPVFKPMSNGNTFVMADDPAWLQAALASLRAAQPGVGHAFKAPQFPTPLPGRPRHHFRHGLAFLAPLTPAGTQALRDAGAEGLDAYALGQTPTSQAPQSSGVPAAPKVMPTASASLATDAWATHLRRWLRQQEGLVNRRLSGWRLPHAELRRTILNGFFDEAEARLRELLDENPDLDAEILRYWIWLEHRRGRPEDVIAIFEPHAHDLANDEVRQLVAQAYLDRPAAGPADLEQAARLLEVLVSSPFVTPDRAGAYLLAARCHLGLGQHEAARAALAKAWPHLSDEARANAADVQAAVGPAPAAPEATPTPAPVGGWDAVIARFEALRAEAPTEAFYALQGAIAQAAGDDVPLAAWRRVTEVALALGRFSEAQAALMRMWEQRSALAPDELDQVRMNLIRDAERRQDLGGVLAFADGWDSVPAAPDVLLALAGAHAAAGQEEVAHTFYRRALALGSDAADTLSFLATYEARRFEATQDRGHGNNAHDLYMTLLAHHPEALTPQQAERWMMVLYDMDRHDDAQQVLEAALGGLTLDELAAWYDVLEWQRASILASPPAPDLMVTAFARHLEAAAAAEQTDAVLMAALESALNRLPNRTWCVEFLEEVEGVGGPALRERMASVAGNALLEEAQDVHRHDAALAQRLLLLIFGLAGRVAYDQARNLYDEAVQSAPAGAADEDPIRPTLAGRRVALVGGYPHVLVGARDQLLSLFGADDVVLVPPSWEEHHDAQSLADKLRHADLVLVMWRCLKHQTTIAVNSLVARGVIRGVVRPVDGKGSSSFVRGARAFAAEQAPSSAAA